MPVVNVLTRSVRLVGLLALAVGCGDDLPSRSVPCVGSCIPYVEAITELLVLTPGDSGQLAATARTAAGAPVALRWQARNDRITIDSAGHVKAVAQGVGRAYAVAVADSMRTVGNEALVVDPDSGAQPAIQLFRDAATGDTLLRRRGLAGHDSIDATVTYVLGRNVQTDGPPRALFQIRVVDAATPLFMKSVALSRRGQSSSFIVRLPLTERDANAARRIPAGFYDIFVTIPLADGRQAAP